MYQERDAVTESGRDRFDLLHRARGIEEEHVGARVHIGFAAPQGGLESFDRDSVGAGNDDEIRILPRLARGPDLLYHLVDNGCGEIRTSIPSRRSVDRAFLPPES